MSALGFSAVLVLGVLMIESIVIGIALRIGVRRARRRTGRTA